jgi:hypothetical protein
MIAQQPIRRALRIMGVIASGETPQASDVQDALDTLNALLAEWHVAGIGIPDYSVATEAAAMTTDVADREAIAYALAFRMAPEYGFEPTPAQVAAGEEAFARLRLRYFQPGRSDFSELPCPTHNFNIVTGE